MTFVSRSDFVYLMNTGRGKTHPETRTYSANIDGEWRQVTISPDPNAPYVTAIDRKP